MSRPPFFVTGTDTEVGKTFVAAALLEGARERGLRCAAVKPVAAGCERRAGRLVNEDALTLLAASGAPLDYDTVNPVALEPAIAPHVAAARADVQLCVADLAAHCRRAFGLPALSEPSAAPAHPSTDAPTGGGRFDFALIEGAGGWLVPLNETETLADLCVALGARPILVVGMRLGCLNHALLTAREIERSGLQLAGWVANDPGPRMPVFEENPATLDARLSAPRIGIVPHLGPGAEPRRAAPLLDLDVLLA